MALRILAIKNKLVKLSKDYKALYFCLKYNIIMKAITYTANETHNTWAKIGYLFENGLFISLYQWFNKPTYFCQHISNGFTPEEIGWGKGVLRSFSDYQFFKKGKEIDLDFEKIITTCKNLPFLNENLSGVNLNPKNESSFDLYDDKRILEILHLSRSLGITDVQNTNKVDSNKVKFIIVGDNPGIEEVTEKAYFVGRSGKSLSSFFNENNLTENFYRDCLILNKTILHTTATKELLKVREKLGAMLFDELLTLSAKNVAKAHILLKVPVFIFGLSELKPEGLFYSFWRTLASETNSGQIFLFKHPSRDHFIKQWKELKKMHPNLRPMELLLLIGTLNINKYK